MGCYLNLTNVIHRQIQHLGLTAVCRDDEHARSLLRKLMVLLFTPIDSIEKVFDDLFDEVPDSLKRLFDYFNGYWMTKAKWPLWNVSSLDLRTNNMVEGRFPLFILGLSSNLGWNHRFNRLVNRHHPNPWHFVECLKKEEASV